MFDGKIVALDAGGRPVFNDLLFGRRPAVYVAFDVLFADGEDVRAAPLKQRRVMLAEIGRVSAGPRAGRLLLHKRAVAMFKLFARSARASRVARDFQFLAHECDLSPAPTGHGKGAEAILLIKSYAGALIRYNVQPRSAMIASMCGECFDQCGADSTIAVARIHIHV